MMGQVYIMGTECQSGQNSASRGGGTGEFDIVKVIHFGPFVIFEK